MAHVIALPRRRDDAGARFAPAVFARLCRWARPAGSVFATQGGVITDETKPTRGGGGAGGGRGGGVSPPGGGGTPEETMPTRGGAEPGGVPSVPDMRTARSAMAPRMTAPSPPKTMTAFLASLGGDANIPRSAAET